MRSRLLWAVFCAAKILWAQSPFQFREAWLLEMRMAQSGAALYDNRLQLSGRDELQQIDATLWRGNYEAAEAAYQKTLDAMRQRGDPAWLLDHIGQSHLEIRDFERAYQNFSEAVRLRRANIQSVGQNPQQANALATYRAHLLKLLIALGRIDLAKGNTAQADQELAEAVTIGNQLVRLEDANNALYFRSLALEKQGKWKEAESLWQEAAKVREKMTISDPNWDMLKDTAAFYARHGDFHAAAEIVKRIQTETAGKQLRPFLDIPGVPDWYSHEMRLQDRSYFFKGQADVAMAEILAMDQWLTNGADAAAPLLADKMSGRAIVDERGVLRRGSDADRARFMEFLTRRAFLPMSILLDGNPSPERVAQAYRAIERVKDEYLTSVADMTTISESDRNNPAVSYMAAAGTPVMLDELAKERIRHAHLFIASALDGQPLNSREFSRSEQAEQSVTEILGHVLSGRSSTTRGDPGNFAGAGTAYINITHWERIDRANPATSHPEYGAFVERKGQAVRYFRLGSANDIEQDVTALENGVVGAQVRGVRVNAQARPLTADETSQHLKRLYQEVIAPLEGSLDGVTKLLIEPDGKLTLAPINAFIDSRGQYLLQRYTVSYISKDLLGHRPDERGPNKTTAPVIVANPAFDVALPNSTAPPAAAVRMRFDALPGAELEAGDVQKALHLTADRVLTGKAAREDSIRSLGGPEILHFATHSVPQLEWKAPGDPYDLFEFPRSLATQDPLLQSVIALAGANRPQSGPEDGLLTGLEIASLRLYGTKLVVLSTCEAGQGVPVDGQGVLGLRAAFAMAGAQGLVMSLWPVDDKAGRLFMQFFYSHLDAGPPEAVRLAQMDMTAKTEYKQPRYWAGYAYSGDPSVKIGPTAGATPAQPGAASSEVLAAPACLEVASHEENGNWNVIETLRVKIAGEVKKSASSPERVTYELLPPSSDLEETSATSINHGPPIKSPDVRLASLHGQHGFPVSLTVERTKDQSAVYIREYVTAESGYKPGTYLLITLKGAPNLFPSFDIPAQFPALGSYTEATVSRGDQPGPGQKLDKVAACTMQ